MIPKIVRNRQHLHEPREHHHAAIQAALDKWVPRLGLQAYDILWELKDSITENCRAEGFMAGRTHAIPDRMSALIDFSIYMFTEESRNKTMQWEEVVVHELLHVLFGEYRSPIDEEMVNCFRENLQAGSYAAALEKRVVDADEKMVRILARGLVESDRFRGNALRVARGHSGGSPTTGDGVGRTNRRPIHSGSHPSQSRPMDAVDETRGARVSDDSTYPGWTKPG